MKIAYFDCFAGASGDMILGALVDSGVKFQDLQRELKKLNLTGYELTAESVEKMHIGATSIQVVAQAKQPERHLSEIKNIIQKSRLSSNIKEKSIHIFTRLAVAEAKIHRTTPEKIHFHEVGGIDAIVDIVGAVIGLKLLEIDRIFISALPAGHGFVNCAHGKLPLPAPATAELTKGFPIVYRDISGEMVTPTGAAILTTLAESAPGFPEMRLQQVGYGAGKNEFPIPNLLRIFIGEQMRKFSPPSESLTLLETNIDDLNPEIYTYVLPKLFAAGALDVYLTPIIMKKNRPGMVLSALCRPDLTEQIKQIIFTETSTYGIRQQFIERWALERESRTVQTEFGNIQIKLALQHGKILHAAPEFADCQRLAEKHNIPLKEVYTVALTAFRQQVEDKSGKE